ncbi:membrane protein insertase YidC [Alteromonadaceae bacterium M269]|nr:membrane protein insertase YidC [Alteromonadaceae bacterium M269]
MESQRSFLFIGLALVTFLLWEAWQKDYGPQPPQTVESALPDTPSDVPSNSTSGSVDVPTIQGGALPTPNQAATNNALIHVVTDTLDLRISPKGGDIVNADLVKFPVELNSEESFNILSNDPQLEFIAQSGLIGPNGTDGSQGRPTFLADKLNYELTGDTLSVPLRYTTSEGLVVIKTFTFTRGMHSVDVTYELSNTSQQNLQVVPYAQLKQKIRSSEGSVFMPTYRGGAYSTEDERYEKLAFDDIFDDGLREKTLGGWAAMIEHYFVAAWVPPQEQQNTIYARGLGEEYALIGYTGQPVNIAAGQSATLNSIIYVGPKDQDALEQIARGLNLTVDYGFLWWISLPLFSLLQLIHSLVGNWGVAIIVITILVKGVMYPLTKAQYTSMAKLRALKPKMDALKDRFGDDRQKMSQGMMELYKKEKVNPMGGCFPLLLQMPIFLALYWVLLESVELRQAEFFLWIADLSVKDPFYVLPILTGISMYLLQKLQPVTVQDPMQQKIMQLMPVFMSIFFLWFPAGLVLYWFISNLITLAQAKIIYTQMEKQGLKTS